MCGTLLRMTVQTSADVAAKVRGIAAERRFTQKDIATELHVSRMSIVRRFSGETPYSIDDLLTLSRFFDVPVGAFFGEVPATSVFRGGDAA